MFVKIELLAGPNKNQPTKRDMNKNIEALERAINGKPQARDFMLLTDTKSIMDAIRDKLPA